MRIGILGVGSLAEYLVRGARGFEGGERVEFLLSPRSATRAAKLAATQGCVVAASNQAVVDRCEMVLICLPAAGGLEILADLRFTPAHLVCSAMAAARIAPLRAAVAPAAAFCAMMPGYANAFSAGPSLLFPDNGPWAEFLGKLGPVHPFADATTFETAAVFGAMSGASVFLMRHLIDWYTKHGLSPDLARRLVAETLRGNAEVLLQSDEPLDLIARGVTTPGGITEMLVAHLEQTGALTAWHEAMDMVLARMSPD